VAEAIASHGAGASSFSDWWAYKVEVMDAIPQNGSLMSEVGVLVSFNSDSSELARRMNTEAAKAVRYGGMDPHEALKVVTSNPAKQLRIDHRTGSLDAGKDGDFVIWSGDPLSTYSRCEQTWIEGARMFSLEEDAELRKIASAERIRIIQKILASDLGTDKDREKKDNANDASAATDDESEDDPERRTRSHWNRMSTIEFERSFESFDHFMPGECGCVLRQALHEEADH
jgi:N-acetylglucosamine-6-phosphate deacetylase